MSAATELRRPPALHFFPWCSSGQTTHLACLTWAGDGSDNLRARRRQQAEYGGVASSCCDLARARQQHWRTTQSKGRGDNELYRDLTDK
jgi:hypothetical protein